MAESGQLSLIIISTIVSRISAKYHNTGTIQNVMHHRQQRKITGCFDWRIKLSQYMTAFLSPELDETRNLPSHTARQWVPEEELLVLSPSY